ncbi:hypothetical protein AB4Z18_03550 [Leifsonia sp. 2TAF2]|uniref:hypothetical protein n=1 Tax=Leifsonia sp. 2TAF2 TaxID=3233009 RepID=UPI003F9C46D0
MSLTARRPSDAETEGSEPATAARGRKGTKSTTANTASTTQKPSRTKKSSKAEKTSRGGSSTVAAEASSSKREALAIGAEPRVDFLPPEVRAERRNARTRRAFGWGVLAVLLIVLVAAGGAFGLNVVSQAQLLTARSETASLLAQQRQFAPVRELKKQVALAQAAQQTGASTEIDWKGFLDQVGAAQPAGLAISSVAVDSISPLALYQQSADPLQGPRVATVTIVGVSAALPNVPAWVVQLQKIPGVADVVPGTVTLDEVNNVYKSTVTIHLSDSLYSKRFDTKGK